MSNMPRGISGATRISHMDFLKTAQFLFCLLLISNFIPAWSENTITTSIDPIAKNIEDAARRSLGQEMWHGYALKNGYLGCAAAVSNVLKKSKITAAHSAGVVIMRSQLLQGPFKSTEFVIKDGKTNRIDDAVLLKASQPGDILLAFMDPPARPNTGGNAHCGIMGEGSNVYTNDWNDGIWKSVNIHLMFDAYRYVRLLRLSPKSK